LRFVTQSNCNVNEKFEGVIVIEQIWCNWTNSVLHCKWVETCFWSYGLRF